MENYILKLVSGTAYTYKLYSGTTLVSDTDLATLFATAGSAYFKFDFDGSTSYAPHVVEIINSSNTIVVYNNELTATVLESKNYKATWSANATAFDTFEELPGKTLDESQLGFLMKKIKNSSIKELVITDDDLANGNLVNASGTSSVGTNMYYVATPLLSAGVYKIVVKTSSAFSYLYLSGIRNSSTGVPYTSGIRLSGNTLDGNENIIIVHTFRYSSGSDIGGGTTVYYPTASSAVQYAYYQQTTNAGLSKYVYNLSTNSFLAREDVVDNLTSTSSKEPLSANQGRILNNHIGDLTTLTTTTKTSAVVAINEVNAKVGDIETILQTLNSGTGAA